MDTDRKAKGLAAVFYILAAAITYDELERQKAAKKDELERRKQADDELESEDDELEIADDELESEETPQRRRRAYRRRVPRGCWVRDWLQNRCMDGDNNLLLEELNKDMAAHETSKNVLQFELDLFEELVERLTPFLKKEDTRMRKSIPVGVKLACTLRHLATGDSYASLSLNFKVSKSAVCIFVPQVCQAIIDCYQPEVMKCPTTPEEWKEVAEEISHKWNYHNCLGALAMKHIAMKKPDPGGSVDSNYPKVDSMNLIGLVDAKYKFLYVDAGDAGTWNISPLHVAIEEYRAGIPDATPLPNGDIPMPYHIVGDDAFAMKPWLMNSYSYKSQVDHERIYNYRLSRVQRVVENAFGILQMKFRVFAGHMLQHPENVKSIAIASCVLHNLLLDRDPLPKHLVDHEDAEHNLVQGDWRETAIGFERKVPRGGHNVSRDAKNIRDYLAHYYTSEAGAVPWQERVVGEGCQ